MFVIRLCSVLSISGVTMFYGGGVVGGESEELSYFVDAFCFVVVWVGGSVLN